MSEQDEAARRKAAEAQAKHDRQAELARREAIKKAQAQAQKDSLPPLVRAS